MTMTSQADDIEPFRAIEVSQLAQKMRARGDSIIHMEFGQPSEGAPQGALDAAHGAMSGGDMGYW